MNSGVQAVHVSHAFRRWTALSKEAALVFVGQAVAGLGAVVSVRILTEILSPAVFGDVALSLTLVMILQYCYAGTSAAAMRFFVPALEAGQFDQYLQGAWRQHHRRGLLVIALAIIGLATFLLTGHAALIPLGLAAVVFAIVTAYGGFIDGMQNAARQRAVVAWHQGASSWLRLGCALLFVWSGYTSATCIVCGFAIAAAVAMGSQYIFYRHIRHQVARSDGHTAPRETSQDWYASMNSYSWPFLIWAIPAWLEFSSDRWFLDWFADPAQVGIYAALFQLAFLPVHTMSQLITQLAVPILFGRAGDLSDPARVASSRSLNTKLVMTALLWTALAASVVAMLQTPIGNLFLNRRYHTHLNLLPLMVLAAGIFAASQLAELYLVTANRTTTLVWPKAVVSILACPAFMAGAYFGGIVGVVWVGVATKLGRLVWVLAISAQPTLRAKEPSL